jgi:hypothetical protein
VRTAAIGATIATLESSGTGRDFLLAVSTGCGIRFVNRKIGFKAFRRIVEATGHAITCAGSAALAAIIRGGTARDLAIVLTDISAAAFGGKTGAAIKQIKDARRQKDLRAHLDENGLAMGATPTLREGQELQRAAE